MISQVRCKLKPCHVKCSLIVLLDPQTGSGYSLIVAEDESGMRAIGQALAARPAEDRIGIDPNKIETPVAYPF